MFIERKISLIVPEPPFTRGRRIVLLPSTDKVSVLRAAIPRRKQKAVTREREREGELLSPRGREGCAGEACGRSLR